LKFGDVVMAAASAMVVFVLVGVPLHLALVSPLGYYWGDVVGMIIAILISAIIVGYVWAGKIWAENRMRAIGYIAILAAVLMGFAVIMETAALPDWGVWVKDKYLADNPGVTVAVTDWYYIEGLMLGIGVFIDVVLVLLLGFVGLYVGSMFKKPVKS
jgi:hypothetical protein